MVRNLEAEEKCRLFLQKGFRVNDDGTIISNTGRVIGSDNGIGYIRIKTPINRKDICLSAHQLVFYNTYGYVPEQINHKNHKREDNRIENLEASNNFHNCQNKKMKGRCYTFNKKNGLWKIHRGFMNKLYHICYVNDESEAKRLGAQLRSLKTLEEILEFKTKNSTKK